MNGINLIPANRLVMRQRQARVHLWIKIAPICISLLAGAYGYLVMSWDTSTADLEAKEVALTNEVESAKKEVDQRKAASRQAAAAAWANKAVAEQPDWGLLLALLADKLDETTVLSSVDLRPVEPAKGAAVSKDLVRPERYTIQLSGYARKQEGVSQFVLNLERLGLFDSVVMKEAKRTVLLSAEAIEFRVECTVTDATGVGQ